MSEQSPSKDALVKVVEKLTDSSIGLDVVPRSNWLEWYKGNSADGMDNEYAAATKMVAIYIVVFFLVPGWILSYIKWFGPGTTTLYALQIYGGLWAGWATLTTKITARALQQTINSQIIPRISDTAAAAISAELDKKYDRRRFLAWSWSIGFVCAGFAAYLVKQDIGATASILAVLYWASGWVLLFSTSTGVVIVSSYYSIFSRKLFLDKEKLCGLDPGRSPLLTSISNLGRQTVVFWLGIAVSIAFMIPFCSVDWNATFASVMEVKFLKFQANRFLLTEIVLASFFSIGVGAFIFVRSEAALRLAAAEALNTTLEQIEAELARMVPEIGKLDDAGWKRLSELRNLHAETQTTGGYRNLLVSGISVLIPFITPIIPIVTSYFLEAHGSKVP